MTNLPSQTPTSTFPIRITPPPCDTCYRESDFRQEAFITISALLFQLLLLMISIYIGVVIVRRIKAFANTKLAIRIIIIALVAICIYIALYLFIDAIYYPYLSDLIYQIYSLRLIFNN